MNPQDRVRLLIVDDEAPARERLKNLLMDIDAGCPNMIAGMAANGLEALNLLTSTPVDIILTDISMPDMDGIELGRHLKKLPVAPAVIYITAYDEYAIKAFEVAAVDYLLKPINAQRLLEALGRAVLQKPPQEHDVSLHLPQHQRQHFSVTDRDKIILVPVSDVLYLRSDAKYTLAHTCRKEYLLDESLIQLEEELGNIFIRIHRNCLVARQAIAGVQHKDGQWLLLLQQGDDTQALPISRRQWPVIKQLISGHDLNSN